MANYTKQTVIEFDEKTFKDFFQKSINDLSGSDARTAIIDNYLQEVSNLLNKINQNEESKAFVDNLKNKPLFFSIILIRLIDPKKILTSLDEQTEMAKNIFDGIFELAKNVYEHSTTKEGTIIIKSITEKNLKNFEVKREYKFDKKVKIAKQDEWNRNPHLWTSYLNHVLEQTTNNKLDFLHKSRKYLDISIADTGTVGIIETAVKEWEGKQNEYSANKPAISELYKEDINTTKAQVESSKDEAKLLYDMYFNRGADKIIELNTQARNAYKGLGIYLFTKFINNNHGIFNTQTNKYNAQGATINFSSFGGIYQKSNFQSPEMFGTRYNIIIPIQKGEDKDPQTEHSQPINNEDITVSKGMYEKMLPLEKSNNTDNYSLGGLNYYKLYKYVIKNNFEENNKTFVLSLDTKDDTLLSIDRTKVFRAISDLFDCNNSVKSVIIKDVPEEMIAGLFEIYTEFVLPNNSFKDKLILLIEKGTQNNSVINGKNVAIIAGNSVENCKKINQYISSSEDKKINVTQEMCINFPNKEECNIKDLLETHNLFYNGQLIALDFFEKGYSYFEGKAKEKLETSIEGNGYKWENTHLKIGSKLHLDDFIYGKRMFQQSKEVSAFAFNLSREIFYKTIKKEKENNSKKVVYTIIGYGYYSELLVSQTRDFIEFLCERSELPNKPKIEYTIIKDDDEIEFSRYIRNLELRNKEANKEYKKQLSEERLVIVVPISSTLTTCLKIENAFYSALNNKIEQSKKSDRKEYNNKRFKILQPFYTLVVVGDKMNLKNLQQNLEKKNTNDSKYSGIKKYWKKIEKNQIITYNRELQKERKNQFNIYIQSQWKLPNNCEHCFPENPIEERPLFVTDKVSVTPTLVFDNPQWYKQTYTDAYKPYFKFNNDNSEPELPIIDTIDWVHYKSDNNKHLNYYLHYLDFFNTNKYKLEKWANKIKNNFYEDKDVLLIVPDKAENGEFINLINREIFDNKANIIRFDKSSDDYLNVKIFFQQYIENAQTIYFVDNLICSGKTFKLLDNIVTKPINGIFCLINRMDFGCYSELVSDLKNNNNNQNENYLYSFVDLYVPESIVLPCPLCEEERKYKDLVDGASLDCIKQYFINRELPYFKEVTKKDLTENDLLYKPLEKHHNSTLLKVALTHFLNKAFADEKDFIKQLQTTTLPKWDKKENYSIFFEFNDFVKSFRNYIKEQGQCNIEDKIVNDLKFKSNVIKVLATQPFRKYRGVYISAFYWVLNELCVFACTILRKKLYKGAKQQTDFKILLDPCKDFDMYIDTVNYLRVLVKYASSLNIAYLLHADFISAINTFINNTDIPKIYETLPPKEHKFHYEKYENMRYSFDDIKVFCAAHITRSLYKNEQRAIQFEKNINFVLEQETNNQKDTSFLELLILENTSIIHKTLNIVKFKTDKKNKTKTDVENNSDYADFIANTNDRNNIETLRNTLILKEILLRRKERTDSDDIEREAISIIRNMASVVGYEISNSGGGLLLYKYQNIENNNNHIVIANVGDNSLSNSYTNMPIRCLVSDILEGKNYLKESTETENAYTWTNFTISYDDKEKKWLGQDGKDYTNDSDILNGVNTENVKRILFIRISNFNKENELKGDAVFVFYDNQPKDKYNSAHSIRFIHTLRNEINEYFEKRYRNDSFRNWVEERKKSDDMLLSLEHHHNHYMKALYTSAIENPDPQKLQFFYNMVYDIKTIRTFMKNGDWSILDDITDIEIKSKIDEYCDFLLEPQVIKAKDNRISNDMTIHFSEMFFRVIMCEYIKNINKAMRLYTDVLGEAPYIIIKATEQNDNIEFSIENNFIMYEKDTKKMLSINENGYFYQNSSGGLPTNKKMLEKIGSKKICVKMERTNINGIGKFTVKFQINNIS